MARKPKRTEPTLKLINPTPATTVTTVDFHRPGAATAEAVEGHPEIGSLSVMGSGVITIPLPARDFIDLPWPSDVDVTGKVPRYTIHAATMAEANTRAAEAERYALDHGAYAVGAPIKVVEVKRQARVEMEQSTLHQTGREAVRAWVARYAEVYPMPEGLTVEGALAMMGVES